MNAAVPRVTVLLPVRNGLPWLGTALESLARQTFQDFELIVLEDGSTDGTAEWLDDWRRRQDLHDRVRIVPTGGAGIARALNIGLAEARGTYIARQDADDESLPTRLAQQVAFLDARPDVDIVATAAEYIDADGRVVDNAWIRTVRQQQDVALTPDAIHALMPLTCCVTHGSILARAATLRAANGYRPDMVPAEDYDLWLRLLPAHRFAKIEARLYRHRIHAAQSGAQARDAQTRRTLLAKLEYLRRVRPDLPSQPRLAIVGATRGDACYRAVAPEAGFRVVEHPAAREDAARPQSTSGEPTASRRTPGEPTPGEIARDWDVMVVTDFAAIDRHDRALRDQHLSVERIGNFFVKRAVVTHRIVTHGIVAHGDVTHAAAKHATLTHSHDTRPLSIVHLTTFLQGGAGRAIVDLAVAQQRGGHEVLVVTSATGDEGYGNYPHHLDRLRAEGVPLLMMDSLFKRDLRLNLQVLQRLREMRSADAVDIVHAHAAVPALVGRLYAGHAARRVAVVQTQHGWGVSKTPAQAAHDLAVLRDVDEVIVTSDATGAWLTEHGVPRDRLTTIPCGLPPTAAIVPPDEARRLLEPLRAADARIIGCVGTVNANKNQALLVRALARLVEHGRCREPEERDEEGTRAHSHASGTPHNVGRRDLAVVFIGEGGDSLTELSHTLGVGSRVHAIGYRPDAERWMALFDLLVVPSLTEGQGLVVLEGFRAGVPVVASDIAPLRHLVTDGDTGWRFDANDPSALADAIARALSATTDRRARMIDAARRRFLDGYSVDVMVTRHEALYRRVSAGAESARRAG